MPQNSVSFTDKISLVPPIAFVFNIVENSEHKLSNPNVCTPQVSLCISAKTMQILAQLMGQCIELQRSIYLPWKHP